MIRNSKNIATAPLNAGRDISIGDSFYKSIEYNEIIQKIKDLEKLISISDNESEKTEYQERLLRERTVLKEFEIEVKNLAKTFSEIKINTQRIKLAQQHFDNGEYKEARAVLNSEEMSNELDSLLREKDQINQDKKRNEELLLNQSDEFLILANLTRIDYKNDDRINDSIKYYEKSLKAYHTRLNVSEYANFLSIYHKYVESKNYYLKLLDIDRKLADNNWEIYAPVLATTIISLGKIEGILGDRDTQKNLLIEAIDILEDRVAKDESYYMVLSMAFKELGNLNIATGKTESAKKNFDKALKLEYKLTELNRDTNILSLYVLLSNMAEVYLNNYELGDAEKLLEKAFDLGEEILAQDKIKLVQFLPEMAQMAIISGKLRCQKGLFNSSIQACQEAIRIYQELAKVDNFQFSPKLAIAYLEISKIYQTFKQFLEAKDFLNKAIDIFENLTANFNGFEIKHNQSIAYKLLADLLIKDSNISTAKPYYKKVIDIKEELANKNPEVHTQLLADTLFEIGKVMSDIEDLQIAESYYLRSLELYQKLSDYNYERYQPDICKVQNNLGSVYYDMEAYKKAEVYFSGATIGFKVLVENDSSYFQHLALTLSNSGNVQREKKDFMAAANFYEESALIYNNLIDSNVNYLVQYGHVLWNLSSALIEINDIDSAKKNLEEAVDIFKLLSDRNAEIYGQDYLYLKKLYENIS